MWILTPLGFFSIVRKPEDVASATLTMRARVRADLDALRAAALPELGPTREGGGTDYPFRARAPKAAVAAALARLAERVGYANFKSAVAMRQGANRAEVYGEVWGVLRRLQEGKDRG